ncbi:MAG: hypothetical protein LH461_03590 [Spirochaetaceae bacterium]|nr:hypothetical protein [Spirochaetaceae bacterium]
MTSVSEISERSGSGLPSTPSWVPASRPVPASMLRPTPQRVAELAHLDLVRLRSYRRALLQEELRTSYWRRLIQARRDLLRADTAPGDRIALIELLTEARATTGRSATLLLHPDAGMPILPHLPELWATLATDDEPERSELFARLASAESVLSSYREALHRRIDRATADLVARYHEDALQCLVALAPPRVRRSSVQ